MSPEVLGTLWVSPTSHVPPSQEEQKTMKSKMREKVRPKMGKIDIDYQKLHDAFFKWQTKPKLTIHGDLYYEVGTPSPMGASSCTHRRSPTGSCHLQPGVGLGRCHQELVSPPHWELSP